MTDKALYGRLSKLGLPMFEPSEEPDVNETLAQVVKSNDTRLWEGFPVILANAAENYHFATDIVIQQLDTVEQRQQFHQLLLLSASVYSIYHLSFPWLNKFRKTFTDEDKKHAKKFKKHLIQRRPFQGRLGPSNPERVIALFELYFEQKVDKDRKQKDKYKEFSMEYALSQVFSPKQKELFKKKLEGSLLTKTEKEYYSRTVKKKVVALANSELHSLARKLLEN